MIAAATTAKRYGTFQIVSERYATFQNVSPETGQKETARADGVPKRLSVGRDRSRGLKQPLKMNLTHFTEIANKMPKKSDIELVKCYGRNCLQCQDDCNLKAAGLNVIKEKQEVLSIHNGTNHRVYLDAVAHRDDLSEMAENLRLRKSDSDCAAEAEMYADLTKALASGDRNANFDFIKLSAAPSPEAAAFAADALRRLFWMLECKPETTMVLLRRVFLGVNQADHARNRKITRQAVNKKTRGDISGIATLLGLRVPVAVKEAKLLSLTPEEFGVYKTCFQDGCTVRSAAIQLKMSPAKIHRLKQKVSSKLNKTETSNKRKTKKTTKK